MLFTDNALFDYVKDDLAAALAARPLLALDPLPCDRWIARSVLQKAIRRGNEELAVRALARLNIDDHSQVWRHLVVIALEDVGTANPELLCQIVATKRDHKWRATVGGDWHTLSGLARLLAASIHCQATCDLLLKAENDPALEPLRAAYVEANWPELRNVITDSSRPLTERAIAALGMGGGLAPGQQFSDPHGLYEIFAELGHFGHVVATCREAWKVSRNPMALLMPLLWQSQSRSSVSCVDDGALSEAQFLNGVPGYALDQFTRVGKRAFRRFLEGDDELKMRLDQAGVASSDRIRAIGDIFFLFEGGAVVRRHTWPEAEVLRLPNRWLPVVATLGHHLPEILAYCQAKARQIAIARAKIINP